MQKLEWWSLEQLVSIQTMPLVKCLGIVKQIDKKSTYVTFVSIFSNGSIDAQATIYEDQKVYSCLQLPSKNQSVIFVGNTYRRQNANKNLALKIKVRLFRAISQEQFESLSKKVTQSQKAREYAAQFPNNMTKTKRSILKELKAAVQSIQMRSLILSCVYITLENNSDLNSYTFSLYTIQNHRLTKSYVQSKKLREESIKYLNQFIDAELNYLYDNQIIELKEVIDGQRIYRVYRNRFTDIEMRVLGIINQRQKTGTILSDIVAILNREKGFADQKNFIFNDYFVQKVLKKFIQQSRIYKTSQKILYPNS